MAENQINFEEARQAWLSCTEAEGRLWLEHIDSHADRIVARQSEIFEQLNGAAPDVVSRCVPTLQMGDLVFNCFAFANWLAHIRWRKHKPVTESENITWFAERTACRGHFPNAQAALKCLYLAIRALDPTGQGRQRWAMRWKPALNAFTLMFEGRIFPSNK